MKGGVDALSYSQQLEGQLLEVNSVAAVQFLAVGNDDVQPISAQPMNVQPMSAQPMNVQPMNVQPTNAQPMSAQPMNVQPMNVQQMGVAPAGGAQLLQPAILQPSVQHTDDMLEDLLGLAEPSAQPMAPMAPSAQPMAPAAAHQDQLLDLLGSPVAPSAQPSFGDTDLSFFEDDNDNMSPSMLESPHVINEAELLTSLTTQDNRDDVFL